MDDIERQQYEEALEELQNTIEGFEHDIFLLRLEIAERGMKIEQLLQENERLKNQQKGHAKQVAVLLRKKEEQ